MYSLNISTVNALTLNTLKKSLSYMYYTPAAFVDKLKLNKLAKV
jgi:hypothetical protein